MTTIEKLMAGGGYNLPFLVHLYSADKKIDLYYVNDNKAVTYGGATYNPGAFSYVPNAQSNGFDGGGKLSVAARGNNIVAAVDTYKNLSLDVIAVLNEKGEATPLEKHSHLYGSAAISGGKAEFTFEKDRRLSMQFPALMWNRDNNRGNS